MNILLVTPFSPFKHQSGAQQRTALLHEALSALGTVDVVMLGPSHGASRLTPAEPGVRTQGFWREHPLGLGKYKCDSELMNVLEGDGVDLGRYSLIVGRYLSPIAKLDIPAGVPTLVDLDDWGYRYADDAFALYGRLKSAYAAWLARRQLGRFDGFFFVNSRDRARHPELQSVHLPNIPFIQPEEPFRHTDSGFLLFVGSLWYQPNRRGIDRFLERCWPTIRASRPETDLLLAGAVEPSVRKAWERHPGVCAPGFVENLEEAYSNAAFTIAPIYSGGGSNIKVLESLAHGRACVTTPYCARAFDNRLEQFGGMWVSETDHEFAATCIKLLEDSTLRGRHSVAGYRLVSDIYSRERFFNGVANLVKRFV